MQTLLTLTLGVLSLLVFQHDLYLTMFLYLITGNIFSAPEAIYFPVNKPSVQKKLPFN